MLFSELFKRNKDVILASYPRSGNTWIRTLMAHLYFDNPDVSSLVDLQKYIPDEHFQHEKIDSTYKINEQFRIIKTHNLYNKRYYKKAVYIYRNPIDVAWSYYNFLRETGNLASDDVNTYVTNFLTGNIPFSSWEHHVKSWMKCDDKLIVSYEAFAKDTFNMVLQINQFLGLAIDPNKVKAAIATATPELVKKITDDEVFYGSNKPNFVNTPLNQSSEEKKHFYSTYSSRIMDSIKIYDFETKKLLIQ